MRWYTVNEGGQDFTLPSVTTILDATMPLAKRAALARAEARDPRKYHARVNEARQVGNAIDGYIKSKVLSKPAPMPLANNLPAYYRRADEFLRMIQGGPRYADELVWDCDRRYAGTLDLLVQMPWGLTVVDIKTTRYKVHEGALEAALLQSAAYFAAFRKVSRLQPTSVAVVFLMPYRMEYFTRSGMELVRIIDEFYQRCRRFGLALTESMDHV